MTRSSDPVAAPDRDIRPIVARAETGNRSLWLFGVIAVILALLLFGWLESRRAARSDDALTRPGSSDARITSPPPLSLPPSSGDRDPYWADSAPYDGTKQFLPVSPRPSLPARTFAAPAEARSVGSAPARRADRASPPLPLPEAQGPRFAPAAPPLPFPPRENLPPAGQAAGIGSGREAGGAGLAGERVSAARLASPSMTVPQGTVIPAVLETALDSTRPGAVRAIVSRDVRGFDGLRILIPRGSRLYGEYNAELEAGQSRALIAWKRLTRPDGAIIALDSPASDPLGRAGVAGKVNSHFLERFGGAILQSALDTGVGIATRRAAGEGVVVALPGSTQNITGREAERVQRTLSVRHGTSVSVFVARDLDFSPVER